MAADASAKDMPRQMLAYLLKSMAGRPDAVAPGVLQGLPAVGPEAVGVAVEGVAVEGVGEGDRLGLGEGEEVSVVVGDGLCVVASSSGEPEAHAPRDTAAAVTKVIRREGRMAIGSHSGADSGRAAAQLRAR